MQNKRSFFSSSIRGSQKGGGGHLEKNFPNNTVIFFQWVPEPLYIGSNEEFGQQRKCPPGPLFWGGHFGSKQLYCKFPFILRLYLILKVYQNAQTSPCPQKICNMIIRKWGGGRGGVLKAVWIFSVFRSIPIRNISLGSSFLGTFP